MALKLNQVIDVLTEKNEQTTVVKIIIEYSTLKQKLDNLEDQSWYFKKSLEISNQKLIDLKSQYEVIRTRLNEHTIDDFIGFLNEQNQKLEKLNKYPKNTIFLISTSVIKSDIDYLNELIALKSKADVFPPMSHYLEDPEAFLTLMD